MRFPEHGSIGAFCGVFRRRKRVIGALFGVIFPREEHGFLTGSGIYCQMISLREIGSGIPPNLEFSKRVETWSLIRHTGGCYNKFS